MVVCQFYTIKIFLQGASNLSGLDNHWSGIYILLQMLFMCDVQAADTRGHLEIAGFQDHPPPHTQKTSAAD